MKVDSAIIFLFYYSSLVYFAGSQPTSTTDSDHSQTTLNSNVPLEFPQLSQNYTFIDNSSIRENLASHFVNDTELADLLSENEKPALESLSTMKIAEPSEENVDISMKNLTEWIENGENTEDDKFIIKVFRKDSQYERGMPLFEGHIAAILAGVFLLLSVIAYGALLSWRRILEMKYGSREMLVQEDDFMDKDDLKHFSI